MRWRSVDSCAFHAYAKTDTPPSALARRLRRGEALRQPWSRKLTGERRSQRAGCVRGLPSDVVPQRRVRADFCGAMNPARQQGVRHARRSEMLWCFRQLRRSGRMHCFRRTEVELTCLGGDNARPNAPPSTGAADAFCDGGLACDGHHKAKLRSRITSPLTLSTGDEHEAENFVRRTIGFGLNSRHLGGHCHSGQRARQSTFRRWFGAEAQENSPPQFDTSHRVQSDVLGRHGGRRPRRCRGSASESKGRNGRKSKGCNGRKSKGRDGRTKPRIDGNASTMLPRFDQRRLGPSERAAVITEQELVPVGVQHRLRSTLTNVCCCRH